MDIIMKVARYHYEQIDIPIDQMQARLFQRLKNTPNIPQHLRATKKYLKIILSFLTASIIICGFTSYSTVTEPKKITPEMMDYDRKHVSNIYNEYGMFERTDKPSPDLSGNEISDEEHVNQNTKQLVTPYGIFIKK
jgi:hypothetical protein